MDPPGTCHAAEHHDTEDDHSNDDDDEKYHNDDDYVEDDLDHPNPSLEEHGKEEEEEESNAATSLPVQQASAPTTTTTTTNSNDDDFLRSSLSAATQNYRAYRSMGGDELTMKRSIDSTRVIVQFPSYATTTNLPSTTTTAAAGPLRTSYNTPIIATAVRVENNVNDAAVFVMPLQQPHDVSSSSSSNIHSQQQQRDPIELSNPQQEKHTMMVDRLVSELGYPTGLAKRLVTCIQTQFVKHYWLIDNSGSMLTNDCVRMVPKDILDVGASNLRNPKKLYDTVKCSRWNELENSIVSHIELASLLEIPTTFRLLKGNKGMQEFTINQVPDDVEAAKAIVRESKPDGVTLLSDHIHEICNHIEKDKDVLLEKGQKAVVVIATDAIPSDQYGDTSEEAKENFFTALKTLQLLPVWIVIRLSTNDRKAMQYYRKLDKKLEIPIECVSDYITESKEVRKWNPWLNYSQQVHQCREIGFHHRVFDLLDERPLTKDDLLEFLTILFGEELFDSNVAPSVHTNWNDFLHYVKNQVLSLYEKQYSPITKKVEDIIDVKGLATAHGIRGSIRNTINKIDY